MALSGTFKSNQVTAVGDYPSYVYVKWTATQDVANNKSTISWKCYGGSYYNNAYRWTMMKDVVVKINGTTVLNLTSDTKVIQDQLLGSGSITVAHDSNGSKTVSASISAKIYYLGGNPNSTYNSTSAIKLNDIPTASGFSFSSSSVYVGENITVNITRNSSKYKHTVKFYAGSVSSEYYSIDTTQQFVIPSSWYSAIGSAASRTAYCDVTTYNGSTPLGTVTKSFTVKVPNAVTPRIGSVQLTPETVNIGGKSYNYLIKGKNKLTIAANQCYAGTGSTIKSYTFSGPSISKTQTSSSASTSVLQTSGTLTYTVTITDARDRTMSKQGTITCYDYYTPIFKIFKVKKTGQTAVCTYQINWPDIAGANQVSLKIYANDALITTLTPSNGLQGQYTINLGNADATYKIYAIAKDSFGAEKKSSAITVFGTSRIFNAGAGGDSLAIGQKAQYRNLFDCAWPARFEGVLMPIVQHGFVTVTNSNTTDTVKTYVQFPMTMPSDKVPHVVVTPHTGKPAAVMTSISSPDAEGFYLHLKRTDGTQGTGVSWIAACWPSILDAAEEIAPYYTIMTTTNNEEWGYTEGGGTYGPNQMVTLTAHSKPGYAFSYWIKEKDKDDYTKALSFNSSYTFSATSSDTYLAVFIASETVIEVKADNEAKGTAYIGVKGTTYTNVTIGTGVLIYAEPNEGYYFDRWFDGDADNPRLVTATQAGTMEFEALFEPIEYNLTVNLNGGSTDDNNKISLFEKTGGNLALSNGKKIVLTRVPYGARLIFKCEYDVDNFTFNGWYNNNTGGYIRSAESGGISITNDFIVNHESMHTTATSTSFTNTITAYISDREIEHYNVTVTSSNTSMGTVSPSGKKSYPAGTRLTITATPTDASKYQFVQWTTTDANDSPITSASIERFVDKDKTYTAHFAEITKVSHTVVIDGDTQYGTVQVNGREFIGSTSYDQDTTLTILAVPNENCTFKGWSSCAPGANPNVIISSNPMLLNGPLLADVNVYAWFEPNATPEVFTATFSADGAEINDRYYMSSGTNGTGSNYGTSKTFTQTQDFYFYAAAGTGRVITGLRHSGGFITAAQLASSDYQYALNSDYTVLSVIYSVTLPAMGGERDDLIVYFDDAPNSGDDSDVTGEEVQIYIGPIDSDFGTISVNGGAPISSARLYTFNVGETVTVQAYPNTSGGYNFRKWQDSMGNFVSDQNPYTFIVNADTPYLYATI